MKITIPKKYIRFIERIREKRSLQIAVIGIFICIIFLTVYGVQKLEDIRSHASSNEDIFTLVDGNGSPLEHMGGGKYKTKSLTIKIKRGDVSQLAKAGAGDNTYAMAGGSCGKDFNCGTAQMGFMCGYGGWCDTPTPAPPTPTSNLQAPCTNCVPPANPTPCYRCVGPINVSPTDTPIPASGRSTNLRSSHFGARIAFNASFNMQRLKESGFGLIRYDLKDGSVGSVNSAFAEDKLTALYNNGFFIMYVYNPGGPRPKSEIKNNLQNLVSHIKQLGGSDDDLEIEIGNESNSKDFWNEGSNDQERLRSFSKFTKDTIDVLNEIAPHATVVLGALDLQGIYYGPGGTTQKAQQVANYYAQALKEAGVNINDYPLAIHVYHYSEDIDTVTDMMKSAFNASYDRFYFTELGVDKGKAEQKPELIKMLKKAYSLNGYHKRIFIHEFNGSPIWGIANNGDDTSLYEDVRSYVLEFEFHGMYSN